MADKAVTASNSNSQRTSFSRGGATPGDAKTAGTQGGRSPQGRRRRKQSEYGLQLAEKQLTKRTYGLRERQFRRYFSLAATTPEATGEKLLQLLETRLDNVVFRLGYGRTRKQARQAVSHGHVRLNGHRVNIASQAVRVGDEVLVTLDTIDRGEGEVPGWLQVSKKDLGGKLASLPTRAEIPIDVNEQLIVEFYSR